MTPTANKLLPVALIAAILGGTAGAFISRSSKTADQPVPAAAPAPASTQNLSDQTATVPDPMANTANQAADSSLTTEDQTAYRNGYSDGFNDANGKTGVATSTARSSAGNRGVAYRSSRRTASSRRAYYDYSQPRSRSFWDKHRDKLTVAMGAGGGALLGGLIGGKKGAGIGALAGGGGSALYTYKIRKRNRQY